ncbi:hypothetical protein QR680_003153 [Steinernema hermaphroditum]|uniref:LRAT domain-containing protein n=1 Tax=Steinernema hermaphroditum TaxID=289476 RepID=A0AA39H5M9_9BILA|nr:hypothetical protein QR680_003153 [Steinernema hermaphroditum]
MGPLCAPNIRPESEPTVSKWDGRYQYHEKKSQLEWTFSMMDKVCKTGSIAFTTPYGHADFPVDVSSQSPDLFCDLRVNAHEKSYVKQMYDALQTLEDISEHLQKNDIIMVADGDFPHAVLYVGDVNDEQNQIIHMTANGGPYKIVQQSLKGFIGNHKCAIVTKIFDEIFFDVIVHEDQVTERALQKVGISGSYKVVKYNCFVFVNECRYKRRDPGVSVDELIKFHQNKK